MSGQCPVGKADWLQNISPKKQILQKKIAFLETHSFILTHIQVLWAKSIPVSKPGVKRSQNYQLIFLLAHQLVFPPAHRWVPLLSRQMGHGIGDSTRVYFLDESRQNASSFRTWNKCTGWMKKLSLDHVSCKQHKGDKRVLSSHLLWMSSSIK